MCGLDNKSCLYNDLLYKHDLCNYILTLFLALQYYRGEENISEEICEMENEKVETNTAGKSSSTFKSFMSLIVM